MFSRTPIVHFPINLVVEDFWGEFYGFYHNDSNEYNIVGWGNDNNLNDSLQATMTGLIIADSDEHNFRDFPKLLGIRTEQNLVFRVQGVDCVNSPYDLIQNVFSRNTGILETDIMLGKNAIISGCGSVGSLVALELARAGLGTFVLVDSDTMAYHNLCRHQCGIQDIGKFKVKAVKERILQINPSAQVFTYPNIIEGLEKQVFDRFCTSDSIIIGCADNREGDIYASQISCTYNIPFVSIGLWQRAFAGEIFYFIPHEMPCYACIFGNTNDLMENRVSQNKRHYLGEEDLAKTVFEPGISIDINHVTLIGLKVIIDLLNRHTPNYIPKVLNSLAQFTLVCNTCDPRIGGEQAEIFSYPLQVTKSIKVEYSNNCPPCQFL